jgi:hypothetical protein
MFLLDDRHLSDRTVFFFICFSVASCVILISLANISTWAATHWLFNYQEGYIKRGLIGTIYQIFENPVTLRNLYITTILISIFTSFLFVYLCSSVLFYSLKGSESVNSINSKNNQSSSVMAVVIVIWLVSASGLIQQVFQDLGRFDVFGWLALSISFISIFRAKKYISLIIIFLVSLISIFIHEGFFFWVPWMSLGMWLAHNQIKKQDFLLLSLFVTFLTISLAYTVGSSYSAYFSFEEAKTHLSARSNFNVSELSLMIHYRDLSDNLTYAAERSWNTRRLLGLILGGIILLPYAILIWFLLLKNVGKFLSKFFSLALIIFGFTPILLFLVGHDQGRWLSMININFAFIVLTIFRKNPTLICQLSNKWALLFIMASVLQLGLGRFGVTATFPEALIFGFLKVMIS